MGQQAEELKARVEAKKKQIKADIAKAEADMAGAKANARSEVNENLETLQGKLRDLEHSVKDGFENVTEAVSKKLNEWLK